MDSGEKPSVTYKLACRIKQEDYVLMEQLNTSLPSKSIIGPHSELKSCTTGCRVKHCEAQSAIDCEFSQAKFRKNLIIHKNGVCFQKCHGNSPNLMTPVLTSTPKHIGKSKAHPESPSISTQQKKKFKVSKNKCFHISENGMKILNKDKFESLCETDMVSVCFEVLI